MRLPDSDALPPADDTELEEAYREMASDAEHEREAREWCEALVGDAIGTGRPPDQASDSSKSYPQS